jgi:hypothetical protein
MKKNILFTLVMLVIFLGASNFANAQIVAPNNNTFPAGCATGLGYSATTGRPCNGENTATPRNLPGCTSPLGYSATNGDPCSGTNVAIQWLAGCSSTAGFSSITGEPCNGTLLATGGGNTGGGGVPGFPQTGAGGNAGVTLFSLLTLGAVSFAGIKYLRKELLSSK